MNVNEFLPRLHYFAESFTGYPVKILPSSIRSSKDELIQSSNSIIINVPNEIKIPDDDPAVGFNIFKGIVSLQASAVCYNGIPKDISELDFGKYRTYKSLDELVYESELGGFLPLCYNIFEIARRMQCINEDYRVLSEDIKTGFSHLFNPNMLMAIKDDKTVISKQIVVENINEIDLALMYSYWKNLGIDSSLLKETIDTIPKSSLLGDYRPDLQEISSHLSIFNNPLNTTFKDSLKNTCVFADYLEGLTKDLELGSVLFADTEKEMKNEIMKSNIERGKDERYHYGLVNKDSKIKGLKERIQELENILKNLPNEPGLIGLDEPVKIKKRISLIEKKIENYDALYEINSDRLEIDRELGALPFTRSFGVKLSMEKVFQDVPKDKIVQLDIPKEFIDAASGKKILFPELRNGSLVPRAVSVLVYDLTKNQPLSDTEFLRQNDLENKIDRLDCELKEYNRKIFSDICYIYDNLPEIVKKRDSVERKIKALKKQLKKSRKIYETHSRFPLIADTNYIGRLERVMERIKPQSRVVVRNSFEGELDEKKFYEYWLEECRGGNPLPNFYYKWEKRKRDVAAILLLDASHSTNRLATDDKTVLDMVKLASYYFVLGAEILEDKTAVVAYNGRGPDNSRIFLLKDFKENPGALKERLELLKGELNNRDGSAIRYGTKYLSEFPAKTKFLFHIGDMQPSDLIIESRTTGILTYPYKGSEAIEDVNHAFNNARSNNIIPVGICLKRKETKPVENKLIKGKLNLGVLKKLKQVVKDNVSLPCYYEELMKKIFKTNYKIVDNLEELPNVLREVYLMTSFR